VSHRLLWTQGTYIAAAVSAVVALGIAVALRSRAALGLFSRVTVLAVVISIAAVVRFAAPVIDATQSARPIAERIQSFSREPVPSRFIILVASGNTDWSFISIVRRNNTRTGTFRPQRMFWLPGKVRRRRLPSSFRDAECRS